MRRLPGPVVVAAALGGAIADTLLGAVAPESSFGSVGSVARLVSSAAVRIWSGLGVNLLSERLDRAEPGLNHDLEEASGRAIAAILRRMAGKPRRGRSRDFATRLRTLAGVVERVHKREEIERTGGVALPSVDLRDYVDQEGGFLDGALLDANGWREWLRDLAVRDGAPLGLSPPALARVATRLEQEYADAFLAELKGDLDQGRAFRSVVLRQITVALQALQRIESTTDATWNRLGVTNELLATIVGGQAGMLRRVEDLHAGGREDLRDVRAAIDHLSELVAEALGPGRDGEAWTREVPLHGNLAEPVDACLGREREEAECVELLRSRGVRCLVIHAPVGIGKSHLAHHVARLMAGDCRSWWVDQTNSETADDVASAVNDTLNGPFGARRTQRDLPGTIGRFLARLGDELLVLDNFETASAHAETILHWLEAAPRLRVIVTSRVHLLIDGPQVHAYELRPLPTPTLAEAEWAAPADLGEYAVVRIFANVARRQGIERLSDGELRGAARICSRLGGFPAPIAIAAGQLRRYDVGTLETILVPMLAKVPDGCGDVRARHYVYSVLDQSLARLPSGVVGLAQRLAQLRSSFDADTASGIQPGEDRVEVILRLGQLIDANLVQRSRRRLDESSDRVWYSIYRPIQERLREQWSDDRAVSAAQRLEHERHTEDWFLGQIGRWNPLVATERAHEALDHMELLREDLVFCVECACARGDHASAARLLRAVAKLLSLRGPTAAFERLLTRALDGDGIAIEERPYLLRLRSEQLWALGSFDAAIDCSTIAVELASRGAPRPVQAGVLAWHGQILRFHGRHDRAMEALTRGVALYGAPDREPTAVDHRMLARLRAAMASCHDWAGQAELAIACAQEATAHAERSGHLFTMAVAANTLGIVYWHDARPDEALVPLAAAQRHNERLKNELHLAGNLTNRGLALTDLGRIEEAMELFTAAEAMHRRQDNAAWGAVNQVGIARALLDRARPDEALRALDGLGSPPAQGALRTPVYDENDALAAVVRARCVLLLSGEEASLPFFAHAGRRLRETNGHNMVRSFLLAADYAHVLCRLGRNAEAGAWIDEAYRVARVRRIGPDSRLERLRRAWATIVSRTPPGYQGAVSDLPGG